MVGPIGLGLSTYKPIAMIKHISKQPITAVIDHAIYGARRFDQVVSSKLIMTVIDHATDGGELS